MMIVQITVPMEAWLGLMGAQQLAARESKELHINYRCDLCGEPHTGVFQSAHPEKLMIQILCGHKP